MLLAHPSALARPFTRREGRARVDEVEQAPTRSLSFDRKRWGPGDVSPGGVWGKAPKPIWAKSCSIAVVEENGPHRRCGALRRASEQARRLYGAPRSKPGEQRIERRFDVSEVRERL